MTTAKKNYAQDPNIYWASEEPDTIGPAVAEHFRRYTERCRDEGRYAIWQRSDACYHGRNPDGGYANSKAVTFAGTQGEVAQIHIGHFRQIVGSQLTIATESRPAVECTATSNDPEAISDTIVARQVLEYDLDEGGLEADIHATHEIALVMSEGYCIQDWDFHAGELAGTRMLEPSIVEEGDGIPEGARKPMPMGLPANDNGQMINGKPMISADEWSAGMTLPGDEEEPALDGEVMPEGVEIPVREGKVRVRVRSPMDVARDLDADPSSEAPWFIVRDRVNKWELAARYPENAEKREAILNAPGVGADDWTLRNRVKSTGHESDYIHLLTLYCPPSDAIPTGRLVEVVDEQWLEDQPYPFDHQVVHQDIPSAELDACTGYGDAWDMLAISQALDASESGALSVQDAGALVNWQAPRGAKVDDRMLNTGMTLKEYDDNGVPGARGVELVERPEVRPSDLNYIEHHRKNLEMLSGVNATLRGEPERGASGAKSALTATMAVRANSKHQRSLAKLIRSVLNGRVKLYKQFCSEERLVEIAGRDKSGHVATFSSKTLENVRRVRVELGPPDLRTIEGKVALADRMLDGYGPEVITPAKYLALRVIGRLDDIDDNVATHKAQARRENDGFAEGKPGQAMLYHHHACHMREHAAKAMDLELAEVTPEIVKQLTMILDHIMEHARQWPACPPELLAATGQDPAPSTLMGPPPGAAPPGGPPMDAPPPDGGPMPPPPANDNGGAQQPRLPMVAGTNQRFEPGQAPPGAAA